jgi:poly(3-hydroxybutyrate) depolymerase
MLYEAYQAHNDILAPIRVMAEAFRGLLDQPWPLVGNAPLVRSAAAAMELLSHAGMSHDRPEFGIRLATIKGKEVAVTEEIVAADPFCDLAARHRANPAFRTRRLPH